MGWGLGFRVWGVGLPTVVWGFHHRARKEQPSRFKRRLSENSSRQGQNLSSTVSSVLNWLDSGPLLWFLWAEHHRARPIIRHLKRGLTSETSKPGVGYGRFLWIIPPLQISIYQRVDQSDICTGGKSTSEKGVEAYLTHKKYSPLWDHHRSRGTKLLQSPTGCVSYERASEVLL